MTLGSDKPNSNQLEIIGDLLHGTHPRPYFEMKRFLTQTYGITDQQRYARITTVSILLVRKANAKGSVSGFEIAPPSKGGGSDKHLAVN